MCYAVVCVLEPAKYLPKDDLDTHRGIHIHTWEAVSDLKMYSYKLLPSLISSETSGLQENNLMSKLRF